MKAKSKTRWGCIIGFSIALIIIIALAYVFFIYILPNIYDKTPSKQTQGLKLNTESLNNIKKTQSFGQPVSKDESTGRSDPFAPI